MLKNYFLKIVFSAKGQPLVLFLVLFVFICGDIFALILKKNPHFSHYLSCTPRVFLRFFLIGVLLCHNLLLYKQ